jgi:hypothetical protein
VSSTEVKICITTVGQVFGVDKASIAASLISRVESQMFFSTRITTRRLTFMCTYFKIFATINYEDLKVNSCNVEIQ